jgi:hypothetical protein
MGSCLSPIVSNIIMEYFEKFSLDSAQQDVIFSSMVIPKVSLAWSLIPIVAAV